MPNGEWSKEPAGPVAPVSDVMDLQLDSFTAKGAGDPGFEDSAHIVAGSSWRGKVRLSGAAPMGGIRVELVSSNDHKAPMPQGSFVVVPYGETELEFEFPATAQSYGGAIARVVATASLKDVHEPVLLRVYDAPK